MSVVKSLNSNPIPVPVRIEQNSAGVTLAQLVVQCVGLAVLRNASLPVRPSSELPVEGIFPLELTWFLTPFPPKLFRMRV